MTEGAEPTRLPRGQILQMPEPAASFVLPRDEPGDATILITGETGTDKEVVDQTIQLLSRRSREPFLPLNCGAVSPSLIEGKLFGHERCSFSGAEKIHKGYFERADRGTLFLDEITGMPLEVKLLRVLETSEVMRLYGNEPIKVDVRVIAATNRCPDQAGAEGRLRAGSIMKLYSRLREYAAGVASRAN